jgi:hypothetical protein
MRRGKRYATDINVLKVVPLADVVHEYERISISHGKS